MYFFAKHPEDDKSYIGPCMNNLYNEFVVLRWAEITEQHYVYKIITFPFLIRRFWLKVFYQVMLVRVNISVVEEYHMLLNSDYINTLYMSALQLNWQLSYFSCWKNLSPCCWNEWEIRQMWVLRLNPFNTCGVKRKVRAKIKGISG